MGKIIFVVVPCSLPVATHRLSLNMQGDESFEFQLH